MSKPRQKTISIVLTIIFVLSLATPVLASDPASIDGVIFDVDGEFILVGLIEYATAYAEKNALYTYLSGAVTAPTITAVVSAGKYIDLTEYATKYAEEGNDVSAAISASTAMTEEDLEGYLELISFDYDAGTAVLELLYLTVTTKWHQNNATIGGEEYDVLVLEFSKPMMTGTSTGSIEVASNYRFKENGAPTATDSLPEGTSLTAFGGDRWVKIVMPQTATANFDTDQLAMGYLVDTTYYGVASYAGVALGTESITLDGTSDARQAIAFPGLTGEIVDDKTVAVDLGTLRNGFGSVSASDFAAVSGGTPITITELALSDESDNGNKDRMTFTFAADTFEAGDTVDITLTASANTTDLFGVNITGGVNNIAADKILTEMIKASVQSKTIIRVQFSESMDFVDETDFRVDAETPTAAVVVTGDRKVWDLTIATIDLAATPIVKTVAVPQSEDVYSNKLTANTTGLTAGNMAVQAVALSQGANIALEGDEKIIITFDSAVDPGSIVSGWTGAAAIPMNVKLYDTSLIVPGSVDALADGDVIVLPGIGKLDWGTVDIFAAVMTAVAPTTGNLATATYALSTDKKTLTVNLVGIDLAAGSIAEGIKGTTKLTITNDKIKAAVTEPAIADYINVGKTGITATQLATPAIDVTVNAVLNRIDFLVNWKYAGGIIAAGELDFVDIYAKINAAHADFSGANGTFTAGVVGLLGSLVVGNLNDAKVGVNVATSTVTGTGAYSSVSGTVPSFDVSVIAFTGFNNAITID